LAAVALGAATWFASGTLLRLGGARRETVEGVVALLAAVVLLLAGHWVLARLDAKRRVEALKRRFAAATPLRRRWILFGLGFVAIYREAFEVVLFLRAIVLDASASTAMVALGAAAGAVLCVAAVVILSAVGRRLKPGPLLAASGTLLCALAVILAGKGVRALQEAGVLGIAPLGLPRVEWLGLFPSLQSVAAQLVVLAAFAAIAAVSLARARRDRPSQADPL
jgi:high-affinity iron transporter